MTFAEEITAILKEREWSKQQLARRLGVGPYTIKGWLKGKQPRQEDTMRILLATLTKEAKV